MSTCCMCLKYLGGHFFILIRVFYTVQTMYRFKRGVHSTVSDVQTLNLFASSHVYFYTSRIFWLKYEEFFYSWGRFYILHSILQGDYLINGHRQFHIKFGPSDIAIRSWYLVKSFGDFCWQKKAKFLKI